MDDVDRPQGHGVAPRWPRLSRADMLHIALMSLKTAQPPPWDGTTRVAAKPLSRQ